MLYNEESDLIEVRKPRRPVSLGSPEGLRPLGRETESTGIVFKTMAGYLNGMPPLHPLIQGLWKAIDSSPDEVEFTVVEPPVPGPPVFPGLHGKDFLPLVLQVSEG